MDAKTRRRDFLILTTTGLSALAANWASTPAASAATTSTGRRIGTDRAECFEQRLAALRRLDDQVGSGRVYNSAVTEIHMITDTLRDCSYSEDVGRRLFAAAAEASRSAGWTAYDSGHHAVAERHFAAALRAAASSGDPVVGVNTMAFWAIQHYSTGNPQGAVALAEAALGHTARIGSARMTAMLHARACRAYAHAGDRRASDRHANLALDTYSNAGPIEDDPDYVYWFNLGELYQLLGSSALNLHDPKRALAHFEAASTTHADDAYDGDAFPRGYAIYLARQSEARLALGDIDGAVFAAEQAVAHMGGVTSARGSNTLHGLRSKLSTYEDAAAVRNFLTSTH